MITTSQPSINSDFSASTNAPLLPVADWSRACGYYNGVISFVGGYYSSRHVSEYDIEAETFTTTQSLPTDVGYEGEYGQSNHFWVQNDVNVYIINPIGTALQVYDLSSKTLTDNIAAIPVSVGERACIAYAQNTLFVMGGGGNAAALNTVQRYNLSASQWLSTKHMLSGRRGFSCIYSPTNDALYAIGGWDSYGGADWTTAEYVTVSDIETNAFQFTAGRLSLGLSNTFAVVYGAEVYVLGGVSSDWQRTYNNIIHVLDTTTNTITVSPHRLAYPIAYTSGIIADNVIYLFGGEVGTDTPTKKWQFYAFSLASTTILNISTSQALISSKLPSIEVSESSSPESIWIPVVVFLTTAVIVLCKCLTFFLYQKRCLSDKKNENPKNQSPPNPGPVIVPNHSSMQLVPMQYAPGIDSHNIQAQPVHAQLTAGDNIDAAAEHKTEMGMANENMVREWFVFTVGLPHFADLFIGNGYENMHLIRGMEEQDLEGIGVRTIYHKQQIVNAIRALNEVHEHGRIMHVHNTANIESVDVNAKEGIKQTNQNVAEDEFVVHGDDLQGESRR